MFVYVNSTWTYVVSMRRAYLYILGTNTRLSYSLMTEACNFYLTPNALF